MPSALPNSVLIDLCTQRWAKEFAINPSPPNPSGSDIFGVCRALNRSGTPCQVYQRTVIIKKSGVSTTHKLRVHLLCANEDHAGAFNMAGVVGWEDALKSYLTALGQQRFDKFSWQGPPEIGREGGLPEGITPKYHVYVEDLMAAIERLAQKTELEDAVQSVSQAPTANQARKI